jgi:hypothetical protein
MLLAVAGFATAVHLDRADAGAGCFVVAGVSAGQMRCPYCLASRRGEDVGDADGTLRAIRRPYPTLCRARAARFDAVAR